MIKQTQWKIKNNKIDDKLSLGENIALDRNIAYPVTKDTYTFHDPCSLNDIESFIMLVSDAIYSNKSILVYGDYDVDGICSTMIMFKTLKQLTSNVTYFIPNRFTMGYGLNKAFAENVAKNHSYDLIITVDCGITAVEEVQILKNAGVNVIITDHHICPEILPLADGVIDCHRKDNTYPFEDLCGAGLALKLSQIILEEFGDPDGWKQYIEYAALATIADVVPLKDENIAIITNGIAKIKENPCDTLKALLDTTNKIKIKNLTATDLAFYIVPKINAASRMDNLNIALNIFLSDTYESKKTFCDELNEINEKRKEITSQIESTAEMQLFYEKREDYSPIVLCGYEWNKGVIGIIASSFAEKYCRPTFVFSENSDGILHGSCRSFKNLNIMDAIKYASEYLITFGGHPGAAGLSLYKKDLENFKKKLNEYFSNVNIEIFSSEINVDKEISFSNINMDNILSLNNLGPFGECNPEPLFLTRNVRLKSIKALGPTKEHLQLVFEDVNKNSFPAMCFFSKEYTDILKINSSFDIVYKLNINEWKGTKTPQLLIEDFHSPLFDPVENLSYEEDKMFRENIITSSDLVPEVPNGFKDIYPSKEDFSTVNNTISSILEDLGKKTVYINIEVLNRLVVLYSGMNCNAFKLFRILDVLYDAGVIELSIFSKGYVLISKNLLGRAKQRISQTPSFLRLQSEIS